MPKTICLKAYNVHFAGLQFSAVKIIPKLSKNRAHQSYLILKYGGFCDFFSQNAGNIHAESVSIWKFVHKCTKFGCTRHSRNKFRSALVGTNSLAADVECIESVGAVGAVLHNIGCTRHSLSKLNSALVGTIFRGGLLPIRQVFRRLCLCGNRCGRGSRRLLEWRG